MLLIIIWYFFIIFGLGIGLWKLLDYYLSFFVCASCLSVVVVFCQSYSVYTLYYLRGE